MTAIFYTAGLHLGHRLVAEIRGFDTVEEHDAHVIDAWNSTVKSKDTVWVLGDLAATSSPDRLADTLDKIDTLYGGKHLITGNHDPVHPMHRDAAKWQPLYLRSFLSVQPFARHRFGARQNFLLSHFPYAGTDHTEVSRYDQYRLRDDNLPLLHGHTHATGKLTHSSLGTPQIHVGHDAWGAPVHRDQILDLLEATYS